MILEYIFALSSHKPFEKGINDCYEYYFNKIRPMVRLKSKWYHEVYAPWYRATSWWPGTAMFDCIVRVDMKDSCVG